MELQKIDLSLFETDRAQRIEFLESILNSLEEGELDPLKLHLQIKSMDDLVNSLTDRSDKNKRNDLAKRYHESILENAKKYGNSFELYNSKFKIGETGTKYDYSECNDPELIELSLKFEKANELLKERQKFLQNVPESGLTTVNEETGETTTIYRPKKSSTTSVTVTLK